MASFHLAQKCAAITKAGLPCKNKAQPGKIFCGAHKNYHGPLSNGGHWHGSGNPSPLAAGINLSPGMPSPLTSAPGDISVTPGLPAHPTPTLTHGLTLPDLAAHSVGGKHASIGLYLKNVNTSKKAPGHTGPDGVDVVSAALDGALVKPNPAGPYPYQITPKGSALANAVKDHEQQLAMAGVGKHTAAEYGHGGPHALAGTFLAALAADPAGMSEPTSPAMKAAAAAAVAAGKVTKTPGGKFHFADSTAKATGDYLAQSAGYANGDAGHTPQPWTKPMDAAEIAQAKAAAKKEVQAEAKKAKLLGAEAKFPIVIPPYKTGQMKPLTAFPKASSIVYPQAWGGVNKDAGPALPIDEIKASGKPVMGGSNVHKYMQDVMRQARATTLGKPKAAQNSACKFYTGTGSSDINNPLHGMGGGHTAHVKEQILELDGIHSQMPPLPQPMVVQRGVSNLSVVFPGQIVGKPYIDHAYVSTSTQFSTASGFASYGAHPALLNINVPAGMKAIKVSNDVPPDLPSTHGGEGEIILPRNVTFVPRSFTVGPDGKVYVEVDAVMGEDYFHEIPEGYDADYHIATPAAPLLLAGGGPGAPGAGTTVTPHAAPTPAGHPHGHAGGGATGGATGTSGPAPVTGGAGLSPGPGASPAGGIGTATAGLGHGPGPVSLSLDEKDAALADLATLPDSEAKPYAWGVAGAPNGPKVTNGVTVATAASYPGLIKVDDYVKTATGKKSWDEGVADGLFVKDSNGDLDLTPKGKLLAEALSKVAGPGHDYTAPDPAKVEYLESVYGHGGDKAALGSLAVLAVGNPGNIVPTDIASKPYKHTYDQAVAEGLVEPYTPGGSLHLTVKGHVLGEVLTGDEHPFYPAPDDASVGMPAPGAHVTSTTVLSPAELASFDANNPTATTAHVDAADFVVGLTNGDYGDKSTLGSWSTPAFQTASDLGLVTAEPDGSIHLTDKGVALAATKGATIPVGHPAAPVPDGAPTSLADYAEGGPKGHLTVIANAVQHWDEDLLDDAAQSGAVDKAVDDGLIVETHHGYDLTDKGKAVVAAHPDVLGAASPAPTSAPSPSPTGPINPADYASPGAPKGYVGVAAKLVAQGHGEDIHENVLNAAIADGAVALNDNGDHVLTPKGVAIAEAYTGQPLASFAPGAPLAQAATPTPPAPAHSAAAAHPLAGTPAGDFLPGGAHEAVGTKLAAMVEPSFWPMSGSPGYADAQQATAAGLLLKGYGGQHYLTDAGKQVAEAHGLTPPAPPPIDTAEFLPGAKSHLGKHLGNWLYGLHANGGAGPSTFPHDGIPNEAVGQGLVTKHASGNYVLTPAGQHVADAIIDHTNSPLGPDAVPAYKVGAHKTLGTYLKKLATDPSAKTSKMTAEKGIAHGVIEPISGSGGHLLTPKGHALVADMAKTAPPKPKPTLAALAGKATAAGKAVPSGGFSAHELAAYDHGDKQDALTGLKTVADALDSGEHPLDALADTHGEKAAGPLLKAAMDDGLVKMPKATLKSTVNGTAGDEAPALTPKGKKLLAAATAPDFATKVAGGDMTLDPALVAEHIPGGKNAHIGEFVTKLQKNPNSPLLAKKAALIDDAANAGLVHKDLFGGATVSPKGHALVDALAAHEPADESAPPIPPVIPSVIPSVADLAAHPVAPGGPTPDEINAVTAQELDAFVGSSSGINIAHIHAGTLSTKPTTGSYAAMGLDDLADKGLAVKHDDGSYELTPKANTLHAAANAPHAGTKISSANHLIPIDTAEDFAPGGGSEHLGAWTLKATHPATSDEALANIPDGALEAGLAHTWGNKSEASVKAHALAEVLTGKKGALGPGYVPVAPKNYLAGAHPAAPAPPPTPAGLTPGQITHYSTGDGQHVGKYLVHLSDGGNAKFTASHHAAKVKGFIAEKDDNPTDVTLTDQGKALAAAYKLAHPAAGPTAPAAHVPAAAVAHVDPTPYLPGGIKDKTGKTLLAASNGTLQAGGSTWAAANLENTAKDLAKSGLVTPESLGPVHVGPGGADHIKATPAGEQVAKAIAAHTTEPVPAGTLADYKPKGPHQGVGNFLKKKAADPGAKAQQATYQKAYTHGLLTHNHQGGTLTPKGEQLVADLQTKSKPKLATLAGHAAATPSPAATPAAAVAHAVPGVHGEPGGPAGTSVSPPPPVGKVLKDSETVIGTDGNTYHQFIPTKRMPNDSQGHRVWGAPGTPPAAIAPDAVYGQKNVEAHFQQLNQGAHYPAAAKSATNAYSTPVYTGLANNIRNGKALTPAQKKMADGLDAAFKAAPPLDKPVIVLRGGRNFTKHYGDAKVGDVIKDHGYGSTSTDRNIASDFAVKHGYGPNYNSANQHTPWTLAAAKDPSIYTITLPPGAKVAAMHPPSPPNLPTSASWEREVLLPRDAQFKISAIRYDDMGVRHVEMTYVLPSGPPAPLQTA